MNIATVSLVFSAVIMVLYSSFFDNKIVYPASAYVKKSLRGLFKKRTVLLGKLCDFAGKLSATLIFLGYCYFGTTLFATYIMQPVLSQVQEYIILVILLAFLFVHNEVNKKK